MHYLYIIYSKIADKFYIGETHDVEERLQKHNEHAYNNSFTKTASDWESVLQFDCIDRKNALFLEQFIKRMKSRKFIEKIISQPTMLNDILAKQ